ncbi:MAG: Spx/MgsR family RNA polymerase-binding regulatory protein [Woeseiaceae bacterium]|jgi:arsenate reductase (glutaredoxin)
MFTLFGIKSCDTCRQARQFLTDEGVDFKFHDLRIDGLDIQTLERWSDRIGWEKLLNRKSVTWRKLPEVDRVDMTRDKAIAAMLERPTLIKRPVIEADHFIAVGFSKERFAEFMKTNRL